MKLRASGALLLITCILNCGGGGKVEPELVDDHPCDQMILAAKNARLLPLLTGDWWVPTGFQLQVKPSGRVDFSNYQYDEPFEYAQGVIHQDAAGLRLDGMYKDQPGTTVTAVVETLSCRTIRLGEKDKFSQFYLLFDSGIASDFYQMAKDLPRIVPDRCLELKMASGRVRTCEP